MHFFFEKFFPPRPRTSPGVCKMCFLTECPYRTLSKTRGADDALLSLLQPRKKTFLVHHPKRGWFWSCDRKIGNSVRQKQRAQVCDLTSSRAIHSEGFARGAYMRCPLPPSRSFLDPHPRRVPLRQREKRERTTCRRSKTNRLFR